jgi:NADPH-dependent 2,4-dienoyl-CoA reductase/sulfur reductase-like enzyme
MTEPGLIVIGSGPAGVGAAEAFRKHNSTLPVRLISADPAVPYERPPLSKDFLRGDTDDVALHPLSWFSDRDIELVRGVQVDRIDPAGGFVVIDGERHFYTALVLATGAPPRHFRSQAANRRWRCARSRMPSGYAPRVRTRDPRSSSVVGSSVAKPRLRWLVAAYP